jgi:4-hydroxy-L-threonine phosphate dehydrogenase PdxA
MSLKPRIGLLSGDPTGIGPEVAAKLLALPETHDLAEVIVLGDRDVPRLPVGQLSREAGAFTLATLRLGAEAIAQGEIDALVYAPLNKQAMKLAGLQQEDEMHFLAHLLHHTGLCSEINVADVLWTSRVTSHVPLRAVADLITEQAVYDAITLLNSVMNSPRMAVAGLNPHAGEGGLLGREEIEVIRPAIERARAAGIQVSGPYPADTLFIAARRGDFDAVVTMYHDQGQIATKLLGFERGVTLHGGLPVPIATPAHGTAFDIAGKGIANVGPIQAAFRLAARLATRNRSGRQPASR